jgi:DNA-binding PadR family transcriptional regulator
MPKLTPEEFDFLRELAKGPRTISGPRSHAGLKRLVKADYVTALEATRGDTSLVRYEITDEGRAALKAEDFEPPQPPTDVAGG